MFEDLVSLRIIRPVRKGWYAYADLDEAMLALRRARTPLHLETNDDNESKPQTGRQVGSKGNQPQDRKAKELLFPSGNGRKAIEDANRSYGIQADETFYGFFGGV